jgi:hypothetical protein
MKKYVMGAGTTMGGSCLRLTTDLRLLVRFRCEYLF